MTDERAQAICQTVVQAVNDGSIEGRFVALESAQEADEQRWLKLHPDDPLRPSAVAKVDQRGRTRVFAQLAGGGSCKNCDIVDLEGKELELFPPDKVDDRVRSAAWGSCDHLLMVGGEPVVVTGLFGAKPWRAKLVAWIAPDGAKRALCYLTLSDRINTKTARAEDAELCQAVTRGQIRAVPWQESFTVDTKEEQLTLKQQGWADYPLQYRAAELDLDMDGKKDLIVRFDYASGAGCGSFSQWLVQAVKKSPDVYTVDNSESGLTGFLRGVTGPPGSSEETEGPFSLKMFLFRGKPYVLASGETTSGSVLSLWGRQSRTWCEFDLLPQHKVDAYYPVESWPAPGTNR
jgi:hypothetical protein